MQPFEHKEFGRFFAGAMAYWKADASEFTIQVWVNGCQPYTLEQVKKAMTAHASDPERGQFSPKVADIVRILSGTYTDRAALAWGKALEAMSAVGAYTDVVFDDAAIHATIEDLGGWPKICRGETKDLGYLQHRFCESYKAYAGRGTFAYPRVLGGDRSPDEDYTRRSLPVPKPALIGDPAKAALTYQNGNQGGKLLITRAHALLPALEAA